LHNGGLVFLRIRGGVARELGEYFTFMMMLLFPPTMIVMRVEGWSMLH